jgi:hypothetical protein
VILRPLVFALSMACVAATVPAPADYASARRKLDSIKEGKAPAGSTVVFTKPEIEAWARVEIPKTIPQGFRDPRVELAEGAATGRATVDLLKMRQAQGQEMNWLIAKLIEGERPLAASVRLRSSGGWCTVDMTRVEISGVAATGSVLDFLVRTFFLSLYPDAKIGKPFELGYHIERIEVHPSGVAVRIGSRPAKQMAPRRPPTNER